MKQNKTAVILVLVAIFSLFNMNVYAVSGEDNITLSRISHILNAVYPLIAKAKKEAKPNRRVRFHYDWLQEDIQAIQAGIAQKINASLVEPRRVQPLKMNYIRQKNSYLHQKENE